MRNNRKELEERLLKNSLKDEEFRKRLILDPKAVVEAELGFVLPGSMKITVVEEKEGEVCLVIPESLHPEGEISVDELETVAGGWTAITDCGTCAYC